MRLCCNDMAEITACSNPLGEGALRKLPDLLDRLRGLGLTPMVGECVFGAHPTGRERAEELMKFYRDDRVRAIFDISGGDLSNEVLEYLDFSVIKDHPKPFWGYSDLTVILNAVYAKTGNAGCLYQIRNLISADARRQTEAFRDTVLGDGRKLYDTKWDFIQGNCMEGIVVGGNIRCFLKLAGTQYFPDTRGKILFLESRSGREPLIRAFFCQLRQMGVLAEISGLLLGTFTEYESIQGNPPVEELARMAAGRADLPIAKTAQIGHGSDSRALVIGDRLSIRV